MDSDERKSDVCGLLGTNVLCHVPDMSETLHPMTDTEDTPQDVARIVRVAGCRPIVIPAYSTMAIHCHYRKYIDIENITQTKEVGLCDVNQSWSVCIVTDYKCISPQLSIDLQ